MKIKDRKKTERKLKKRLAKKQKGNNRKFSDRFRSVEVPVVKSITPFKLESFKSYYSRWPKSLRNIPKNVVEQWVYYHNDTFLDLWSQMNPTKWSFKRVCLSIKECLEITHLPNEIEHYEYVGYQYIDNVHDRCFVANFMLEHGRFPQPIIIAKDSEFLIHPKSGNLKENMTNNQLIEGHNRLGLLRAMSSRNLKLKSKHKVWLMRFN